jgi:hypothetical protein
MLLFLSLLLGKNIPLFMIVFNVVDSKPRGRVGLFGILQ